jgi:hypothetical protein
VSPVAIRQSFFGHQRSHPLLSARDVDVSAGKEPFQREAFVGSFRMQREVPKSDVDIVSSFESFNTDRTEITPRSDVI